MIWLFIILILIIIFSGASSAKDRKDDLGKRYGSCERGRIELYKEMRGTDGKDMYQDGDGDHNNSYTSDDEDVNGTVKINLGFYSSVITSRQGVFDTPLHMYRTEANRSRRTNSWDLPQGDNRSDSCRSQSYSLSEARIYR